MKLSIILPVYNEVGSLEKLYSEIKEQFAAVPFEYEIIAIDDGSTDGSAKILDKIAGADRGFKVVHLSKNYGQTAALSAGFDRASGEVLVPMDSDLQNDPADIPMLLDEIDRGFDVAAGWRKDRKDGFMRRLPSVMANALISRITGVFLHDYGCTMKAYRRDVIKNVRLYGEMHRFIPAYVAWNGARIREVVVNHRPREHDKSKYGISRTFRVILDLLTVKFLMAYLDKPMHFFGWAGFISFFLSFISGFTAIILRFDGVHFNRTPLPLLTIFLIIMGAQFILMGVLAEILIRIYHEPKGKSTYAVKSEINFKNESI